MKREDLIDALEYIDDDLIQEADQTQNAEKSTGDPEKITPLRRKASIRRWGAIAAGLAVFMIGAFALSGVFRTQKAGTETMQSAETVQTVETGEAQADEYAVAEKTDMYYAEEQVEVNTAAEQADVNTAAEQVKVNAGTEHADEYVPVESESVAASAVGAAMIRVISDAGEIRFALNNTPAAESLASQLPLTVETELYSDNEIVFHPEEPLPVENGIEGGGIEGYIGYYAPWNNVVLYYGDLEKYPGLYILGEAVSGAENIKDIRGSITIERE